jgi:glycosyltransferase involved in cell wall biosynthesis
MEPFFSILIPTYSRPEFLKACIDSVLLNDFEDYEVILADDSSPRVKEITEIIEPYLRDYKNISFFQHSRNLGIAENWNFLVKKARGKYIILMGDDDKLLPSSLRTIRMYIEGKPDRDIYAIGYSVIDENADIFYSCVSPIEFEINLINSKFLGTFLFSDIIPFWVFHPFTMCCHKRIYETIKYEKKALTGADLLFLIDQISSGTKIFVIPEVLFLWRKAMNYESTYRNLSGIEMNNISARLYVYRILQQRHYSSTLSSGLLHTVKYKTRFLYNAIITSTFNKSSKNNFGVMDIETLEILRIQSFYTRAMYKLKLKAGFVLEYLNLFGIKGFFSLTNRSFEMMLYRIKKMYNHLKSLVD